MSIIILACMHVDAARACESALSVSCIYILYRFRTQRMQRNPRRGVRAMNKWPRGLHAGWPMLIAAL